MEQQVFIDLYKEAAEFAYKICKEEGREGGPSDHIWQTLSTGKFAELIVLECAKVSENHRGMNDKYFIADAIKKHFGVK